MQRGAGDHSLEPKRFLMRMASNLSVTAYWLSTRLGRLNDLALGKRNEDNGRTVLKSEHPAF